MQSAEKLYTTGYISYPRTETNIFPKELDLKPLVEIQTRDNRWSGEKGEFLLRLRTHLGKEPLHLANKSKNGQIMGLFTKYFFPICMKTLGFVHMVFWHYLFLCVTVSYESSFHTTAKKCSNFAGAVCKQSGFFSGLTCWCKNRNILFGHISFSVPASGLTNLESCN